MTLTGYAMVEQRDSGDLLREGLRQYLLQGYFVGRGVLPVQEVNATTEDIHKVFVQQLRHLGINESTASGEDGLHQDMRSLLAVDTKRYIASLKLCANLFSMHELFMSSGIRELTRAIGITMPVFQTSPVFHVMADDLRIPGGYYGYDAHQDWPALQSGLDTVTIWIPFVQVDDSNYTLDVVPGSHLRGLYPGSMGANAFEIDSASLAERDFVPIRAEPGDALFMSCFLVHRSSKKGGKRLRVACSMRYENGAEPSFIRKSYPTAHQRVVQREFLFKELPGEQEIAQLFRR